MTDDAMVERVALAMFEAWAARMAKGRRWDRLDAGDREHWCQDARDAIAAMQPDLAAAREAGWREGVDRASAVCIAEAEKIRRVNMHRGHVNSVGTYGSDMVDACAEAIRALLPAPAHAADAAAGRTSDGR